MSAGSYNITAEQGATFELEITWKDSANVPVDLTGYTARMQIRLSKSSSSPLLSLTTENGRIELGGVLGTICLYVDASTMETLASERSFYDLELIVFSAEKGEDIVYRLIEGSFTVNQEVTK